MAFDTNPEKIGTYIGEVPVFSINDLESKLNDAKIAILTVPSHEAEGITDRLVNTGIEGILNFTPARLSVPGNVRVHHIDLAVELQALAYFLKHYPLD